jgi:hypothetical protein
MGAGYLYLEDTLTGTMIMVAAIGAARSWLLVPQPLVVVENVSVDQFAAAYGVYAIVSGIISVFFGPFAGEYWSPLLFTRAHLPSLIASRYNSPLLDLAYASRSLVL